MEGFILTRSVQSADWGAICYIFLKPGNDSTEVERIQYARAYILEMIRGYLMSNLSRNLVHLMWLLKLVDFRAAGQLSWGSAVLATLYREICRAKPPNKAKIRSFNGHHTRIR
ncbi:hypothetical protein Godav_002894 [Gossypium davidsonii]|uniref:Aminotransferase-like plant mobile domain-containing protein n=1 Tax=Gossypium davidsonii TaxID=34287 RepID=A0A7J8SZB0_GOSDV|nr:hypothetical protein [Gossypium davidsonii]